MNRSALAMWLLVWALSLAAPAAASTPFRTFGPADGLPASGILCLFQDRDGIVWAGTGKGAARFEGRGWQALTVDDGLAGDTVHDVAQGAGGSIWFATSGGVSRFDGDSWNRLGRPPGISGEERTSVVEDAEGKLWFAGGSALYVVDPAEGDFRHAEEVDVGRIEALFLDRGGSLWVTGTEGVASHDGFRWTVFGHEGGFPAYEARAGVQDEGGAYWFATSGGLVEYNGIAFRLLNRETSGLPSDDVRTVSLGGDNLVWVGTDAGPAAYDGYRWRQPDGIERWPERAVESILLDTEGNLWAGTAAGAVFVDLSWSVPGTGDGDEVPRQPFLRDSAGRLWYGVEGGVQSLRGRLGESWGPRDGLEGTARVMLEDRWGDAWIGTDRGLFRFDGASFEGFEPPELLRRTVKVRDDYWESETYRRPDSSQGLTGEVVQALIRDGEGLVWVGTSEGLSAYDGDKWLVFENASGFKAGVTSLAHDAETGRIWAGTPAGVMVREGDEWRVADGPGTPGPAAVTSLLAEGGGNLWVGTAAGLWHLKEGSWRRYGRGDGLLDEHVTALCRDHGGLLWVGTPAGVGIFDGVNWSSLTRKDGLPFQGVGSLAVEADGRLILAGEEGLVLHRPDTTPPETMIKNLPKGPIGVPQILFEFDGADLRSEPFELVFSYRLDGGEWSPFSKERLASLADLANGMHTFEVRAMDRFLNKDPTPARSVFEVNTSLFDVEVRALELEALYASLHRHYAASFEGRKSPVGRLVLYNRYDRPLKVKVSLIIPRFMDFSTDRVVSLQPGLEFELPLRLEMNESVMGLRENVVEQLLVTLQYHIQGELKETAFSRAVTVQGRNAMSWEDPRRICLFISHLDPEIESLARKVLALGKELEEDFVLDNNFIRAVSLFDYLGTTGLHYLADPEHPYTGLDPDKKVLDFIRYPRETLALRSGDCDDLSVLYAALLQSVGIDTALVDVLDHVLIMFDTGLKGEQHLLVSPDRGMLVMDDQERVWVPVETTLVGRPFMEAWRKGTREVAREPKRVVVVKDAWAAYQPLAGGADVALNLGEPGEGGLAKAVRQDLAGAEDVLLGLRFSEMRARLEEDAGDAGLRNSMGVILAKKGYFARSERFFRQVIAQRPEYPGGYVNLANVLYERGRYDEAIGHYRKALELDPDDSGTHIEIALTFAEMGDFDRAREHYLLAVEIDPSLAGAPGR